MNGKQISENVISRLPKYYRYLQELELKKIIPQIKDKHTIYDPIGINRTGKDLTIVISDL